MDIKRAIWTGVISWVLIFFEVSIIMFCFKIKSTETSIVHYILFPFTITIPALIYFKKPNIKIDIKHGIYLSLIYFATGLVLDSIITIPLFVKDYYFLLNPYHLIGFVESLIITILIGLIKKK